MDREGQLGEAWALLAGDAVPVMPDCEEKLRRYVAMVREWTARIGLVSGSDAGDRLWEHVLDALSLAAYVPREENDYGLLDIGSGGGFPGLVLAACTELGRVALVERSSKKAGFLRMAAARLGLDGCEVLHGSYPDVGGDICANAITARAIERPEAVHGEILGRLQAGEVFLCQREPVVSAGAAFHVEHIEDAWTARGLRRGVLYRIHRK